MIIGKQNESIYIHRDRARFTKREKESMLQRQGSMINPETTASGKVESGFGAQSNCIPRALGRSMRISSRESLGGARLGLT